MFRVNLVRVSHYISVGFKLLCLICGMSYAGDNPINRIEML